MAKNKKPKFLEKETPDLLALLKETLAEEEADTKKALKITEELISRLPQDEGPMSVDEALKAAADQMTAALNNIKGAYDNEVSMMEDSEEEPEEEAEEEETPKAKKGKKSKKAKKEEPEEDEDDSDEEEDSEDDEDEDDGEDYTDWSTKDLKKECRTRGIKVTKGMGKAEMVKALEADDKE
jgi:hypothetical protein